MIKVIGLDISMNNLGVCRAIVDPVFGTVDVVDLVLIQPDKADAQTKKQVRKNSDDLRRFKWLHDKLHAEIHDCHIVTVEMPVGSQSARAMASYGGCIGVLASVSKPMIEVTPNDVKLAGAGAKTATKQEMIDWATNLHPNAPWKTRRLKGELVLTNDNEHLADSIACVYAGMKTAEFKAIVEIMKTMKQAV